VRSCLLLAKVFKSQRSSGQGQGGQQDELQLQSLTDAWTAQKEVLALAKGRDADLVVAQREAAADIAYQLAQVLFRCRQGCSPSTMDQSNDTSW
jgi:hypothetical protein